MGGNEGSISMLQGRGGEAQPGIDTVSIRLARLRPVGVGRPAHWVQAVQGIWLTGHGHADRGGILGMGSELLDIFLGYLINHLKKKKKEKPKTTQC